MATKEEIEAGILAAYALPIDATPEVYVPVVLAAAESIRAWTVARNTIERKFPGEVERMVTEEMENLFSEKKVQ